MNNRIIDISEYPADLRIKHQQLIIRSNGHETTVPLEDIGAVIVSNPAVRMTLAAISGLTSHNAGLIVCDEKYMPVGMMLPMSANYIQTERMTAQAELSQPAKKGLWRTIIKAKILSQALVLKRMNSDDAGLARISRKVRSGDIGNLESQASRIYWPKLFGPQFRRQPQGGGDLNGYLNFGYAVIRSMIARAICAGGLNPTLGLHHRNRYNPFCLADDLMEPYRPIVDALARTCLVDNKDLLKLDRTGKQNLISGIIGSQCRDGENTSDLFVSFTRVVSRLVNVIMKKQKTMKIPMPIYGPEEKE